MGNWFITFLTPVLTPYTWGIGWTWREAMACQGMNISFKAQIIRWKPAEELADIVVHMTKEDISDKELDKLLEKEEEKIKQEKEEMKKAGKPSGKEKPEKEEPKKEPGKAGEKTAEKPAKPAVPVMGEYNPWGILLYPHLAEKSMNMVELENKLVFIVNIKASKNDIKEAVEKGFDVKVAEVRTEITTKGQKKAYVKLAEGYEAADVASRLGMI